MKKLLGYFLVLLFQCGVYAQTPPAFRQFYFNPFVFNPAYVHSEFTDVYVVHRQQWINFNDAPYASGLGIRHPINSKTAIAFNLVTQKAVALRNTSAMGTFGYTLPLSSKQNISFAVSGGFGSNNLDLDGMDYTNDPTILNAAANAFYADGNFGLLYTRDKLKVGFALPRLFGQRYFSPYALGKNPVSQLLNQLYSVSYTFDIKVSSKESILVEPYFLYRLNRDLENYWDLSVLAHYKEEIVSLGVSYHSTQGVGLLFGMRVEERLRFSYSFELPVSPGFKSVTSHELQLRARLVKKTRAKAEQE